jgi:hypothetical protein
MMKRRRRRRGTYPRLEAEATAWRGSARAAVTAANLGRTPALHRRAPRTAQHPGDDGTGAANAAPAPRQSQVYASVDDEVNNSPETTNRRRRFVSRSGREAIWRRKRQNRADRSVDLHAAVLAVSAAKSGAAGLGRSVASAMAATQSPHESTSR